LSERFMGGVEAVDLWVAPCLTRKTARMCRAISAKNSGASEGSGTGNSGWIPNHRLRHVLTKAGFLVLEPIAASPALIEAARPLRHDAFEAQIARLRELHRALGAERFAEHASVESVDEPHERFSPRLMLPTQEAQGGRGESELAWRIGL
jgi:hypothetical protein